MPLLSEVARRLKARWLNSEIAPDARVLEVGPGGVGMRNALGQRNYTSIDLVEPADFVGCILSWRDAGLEPASFDAIVAFEVVEHVDCLDACWSLLRDGGALFLTTPVPRWDPWLERLELVGLCQRRTSPHVNLVDLRRVRWRGTRYVWRVAGLSQWARLTKDLGVSER